MYKFDCIVEQLAANPFCCDPTKKTQTECTCLHLLRDASLAQMVSQFLVNVEKNYLKQEKDQMVCDWFKYANLVKDHHGKHGRQTTWYLMPYDGNDCAPMLAHKLGEARICTSTMINLMKIGYRRMKAIRLAAKTTDIVKSHGLAGKMNAKIKEDAPQMPPICEHFEDLIGLGEVRPTQFIQSLVDRVITNSERTKEDGNVYLPCHTVIRRMFYLYMKDR